MFKILLVEDDKNISEMITDYLTSESYIINTCFDGEDAINYFNREKYDLILLDLMIPKINGIDVLRKIRKTSTVPIIIITAKDDDNDKAVGLGLGADDYITKPFSLVELSARIKANIRRVTQYIEKKNNIIFVKDLEIDLDRYSVTKNDENLNFTQTEFGILKLLASNKGKVFSKEMIYNHVWNEPYYGEENVINLHIRRIRKKIEDKKENSYIKTLWGIGYCIEEE
ncbi:response regulator transcription factor [Clostridium perfringens]|uniref:response regulator transcription factor n=1 Tax=Clostridium perfringens TaxID=1502 RepID=UPI001898E421|nr:response regulator transcription factor [Clostridium perfringens]EHK2401388.1 response regulator transcription factor [Clostridium perfringens]HAT4192040.1 response regulator transcription factor [Clostridium perfringens]